MTRDSRFGLPKHPCSPRSHGRPKCRPARTHLPQHSPSARHRSRKLEPPRSAVMPGTMESTGTNASVLSVFPGIVTAGIFRSISVARWNTYRALSRVRSAKPFSVRSGIAAAVDVSPTSAVGEVAAGAILRDHGRILCGKADGQRPRRQYRHQRTLTFRRWLMDFIARV